VREWGERAREQLARGLPEETPEVAAPLIQGRHLIALGQSPGPWFRTVLDACHAAQLAGEFTDEAGGLWYLASLLSQHPESVLKPPRAET
jgi:hypothetical protein